MSCRPHLPELIPLVFLGKKHYIHIILTITNTKMKPIVVFVTEYFTEMFTKVTFLKPVKFSKLWHKITTFVFPVKTDRYDLFIENKSPNVHRENLREMLEPYTV